MRLKKFILDNKDSILNAWSEFFNSTFPLVRTREIESRQKSQREEILAFIARDIELDQTLFQQGEKSKGKKSTAHRLSAGGLHGTNRIESGLDIIGIVSEYRALRASVIHLWLDTTPKLQTEDVDDLIRFNEAIDQALADSVKSYSIGKEKPSQLVESLLSSASDQAYLMGLNGKITYANKAVTELYGIGLKEIVGKDFIDLNFANAQEIQNLIQQVSETQEHLRCEVCVTQNGTKTEYEYLCMPVLTEAGSSEAVAIIARDVTKRKFTEDESWHNANYDALTGLPNRRMFMGKLEEDIKHFNRLKLAFSLMFIDLDNFKAANDKFGHDCGDELLKQAAERISVCIREADTVARIGGDEFTVILRDLNNIESATLIANKVIQQLRAPFHVLGNTINISGSIGVTYFPKDGLTVETLFKNADKAMYAAKDAGRDQFKLFKDVT